MTAVMLVAQRAGWVDVKLGCGSMWHRRVKAETRRPDRWSIADAPDCRERDLGGAALVVGREAGRVGVDVLR